MKKKYKIILLTIILVVIAIIASLCLVIRSKSAEIITFDECEKSGWLVRSITLYDGDNLIIEKECELWTGRSFKE